MVGVPTATPVTTPVEPTTVAWLVVPLVHVPPPVAEMSVVVLKTQTLEDPVIAAVKELEVTGSIENHPVPLVLVIVGVPAATPCTTPVVPMTVAWLVVPLVHVPPPVAELSD